MNRYEIHTTENKEFKVFDTKDKCYITIECPVDAAKEICNDFNNMEKWTKRKQQ